MPPITKSNKLLCIGAISGVHGIKGEVRITAFTQNPENLLSYGRLLDKNGNELFDISDYRITPKAIIVRLSGIDSRNKAEKLKGTELFIQRDALPETDEDEFYHSDLTGLDVRFRNGTHYGIVKSIQNFGAGDLVEILPDTSMVKTSSNQKKATGKKIETVFFNFTQEIFPKINISDGFITLLPPKVVEDTDKDQADFLKQQQESQ